MIALYIIVLIVGSYVDAMSDQVVTIQPGFALQDYLCNGTLLSNITVVLDGGEHRLSSERSCNISNEGGSITITGSSTQRLITIRCERKGRAFVFVSVRRLRMERITFINCGIQLISIEITFILNCTFRNSSNGAISSRSSNNTFIASCAFSDTRGGALTLHGSTGNVSITNCTFLNNRADGDGGAVSLSGSFDNAHITDCTFQDNRAGSNNLGGAVSLSESTGNAHISGCTFQDNRAGLGGGAVSLSGSYDYANISGCTFQNNWAGAVSLSGSLHNAHISDCTFQNNSANRQGGAVSLYGSFDNARITGCTFQDNRASSGGGGAVSLQYEATGNVYITCCTFQNNSADRNGGAINLDGLFDNAQITGGTFHKNSAGGGGGAMYFNGRIGNVSITNSTFYVNNGQRGGAISIDNQKIIQEVYSNVSISMSSFTNNTSEAGAAIYAYQDDIYASSHSQTKMAHLILQDVIVKDNNCPSDKCAGAIYFRGVIMEIIGSTSTGSHFVSNSPRGAVQGENGLLLLRGYITFANNTGVNGGAISLSNNVPVYFYENCDVTFFQNVANGYGGAIYNHGKFNAPNLYTDVDIKNSCIVRFRANDYEGCRNNFRITFVNNHAQQGGHAVYATPINGNCYDCFYSKIHMSIIHLVNRFNITPLPGDIKDVQVLSFPDHVYNCGCSDPNLCNGTSPQLTTYPGRTLRIKVTSLDNANQLSPSVVYTQVNRNGITSQDIMLGPRQQVQWIGSVCGTMEYNIYGPEMASLQLLLYNDPSGSSTVIDVRLLPCGPWFTLTPDMECNCSQLFTTFGVVCDPSQRIVTRNKTNWIGVYKNTLPALARTCPLDYCNSNTTKLSPEMLMDLCNGERAGIICGHCPGNLSVVFGSSKCQECSDMWLTTLVMFAVLGVFLVAALFFLNLTITQGTLYGLIFYANIIQVNTSIFFKQSILNRLHAIVSLVNLDLGLPMCFYKGMDDADKAGLQFVFPAYLLIITMATIVVCHYCLQRSTTSSTGFSIYRVSYIIGERAVGVLSTLIYLSYFKLLRTIIDILTYSTVHLPSGVIKVWFYDGNVEYLHGKHTALFVVAIATCILFLLPYTIALTFIPIIEQYSEHNRLLNYLNKKTNQIKPMNDAHYAPYKGEWRWWLGARLWLLVVMNSLNPVYSSDKPSLLLTIQATMVILFTIAQASIKPFGQSYKTMHQSNRHIKFYNQLYNSLDMFYLLNYTALAMIMSYIIDQGLDHQQVAAVTVSVLVGLYVVMLMVTVMYHLIVAILKACMIYDITREKFIALFETNKPMVPTNMELDELTDSTTVSTTTVAVREPLCED